MTHVADLGDFLYIIIAVVLMVAGGLEKYIKAKKQQQSRPISESQNRPDAENDPFEDEDFEEEHNRPQTLEEVVKRMLQTTEKRENTKETDDYPVEAQSLETLSEEITKGYEPVKYEPIKYESVKYEPIKMTPEEKTLYSIESEETKVKVPFLDEYEFDLRKAVISQEILQRKYS